MGTTAAIGTIHWADLTVRDAAAVRDFYSDVVGWKTEPVDMGGYADYSMKTPGTDQVVAGICHARGINADLPAAWLVYITVDDLERRAARCAELGGRVLVAARPCGDQGRYCVIQDPSGAVAALFEPA